MRLLPVVAVAVALGAAGTAHAEDAELIAGWDFSQYFGDALLSVDGETYTSVLSANYSALDPTFGAGAESADFGTMYIDGSFGSTAVAAGSGNEPFLPSQALLGSLASNLIPDGNGGTPFDFFSVLSTEGQSFTELMAMIASAPVSVVFEADLSSVSQTRDQWRLSFAGRTFQGTSTVTIDFSTDGSGYTNVASIDLTEVDTRYVLSLGSVTASTVYTRFNFSPEGVNQPFIDNVAIQVPEVGPAGATLAAILSLALLRRAARPRRC